MATKNWTQTTAGSWNETGNWDAGVPSSGDNAVLGTDIASNAAGVVTISGGDTQVASMSLGDSTSPYYSWTVNGSSAWDIPAGGGEVSVTNSTSTISVNITGTGPLKKVGAAKLILSGANTFSGGVEVSGGTLDIIDGDKLGSTKSIKIKNNSALSASQYLDTSWFDKALYGAVSSNLSGSVILEIDPGTEANANLIVSGNNISTGGFKLTSRNSASPGTNAQFLNPEAMGNGRLYFNHQQSYRINVYNFGPATNPSSWTVSQDVDFGSATWVTNGTNAFSFQNGGAPYHSITYTGNWTGGGPGQTITLLSPNANLNTRHVISANLQQVTASSLLLGYNVTNAYEIASANSIPALSNVPAITTWPGAGSTRDNLLKLSANMTIPQRLWMVGAYDRGIDVPSGKTVTHTGRLEVTGVLYVTGAGTFTNSGTTDIAASSGIIFGQGFSGSLIFRSPSNSRIGGTAGAVINASILDPIIPQGITLQLEGATFTSNYPVDVSKITGLAAGLTGSLMLDITGSGGITKIGAGQLVLGGNNTFAQPVTHSAGVLRLGSTNSAGAFAGAKIMHNLSTTPTTTKLSANSTLDTSILDNYLYASIDANLSGTAPIRKSFSSYSTHLSGTNTHTGGTIIDTSAASQIYASSVNAYGSGPLIYSGSPSSTANLDFYVETMANETLTNNIYFTPAIGRRRIFKRAVSADATPTKLTIAGNISGTITNEAFVIRTADTGKKFSTIELSGDNSGLDAQFLTFAGASDGSYIYNGQSSLPKTSTGIRWQTSTWDGNTITFSGSLNIPNYIEIWGIGRNLATPAGQTTTVTGIMGITGSTNVDAVRFVGPGDWVQNGIIAGAGSVMVSGSQGRLTLGASNTYAGSTFVTGTLIAASGISSDAVFGTTPVTATANKLLFANGSRFVSSASFQISSNRGISVDGNTTFDIENGKTLTYGGIMAGSGLFSKNGTGTITLSGLNTLTGGVSVNEGILEVPVIDTIASGSITVAQNGHLKATNYSDTKVLKVNSTLTFAGGTLTIG